MGLLGPADYSHEPSRIPNLVINAKQPFNAETLPAELCNSYITPASAFYVRNHAPVPIVTDAAAFRLQVAGLLPQPLELSLEQIRALPSHTIAATLQCAGNRRTEMSLKRTVRGVGWSQAAIGNATWTGALLADVLRLAGIPNNSLKTPTGGRHVEFVSVDACPEEKGGPYKASLPLSHVSSPANEVLLVYKMNGEELTPDHGFPLRIVAPGVIGARSVKWLQRVELLRDESQGYFMQRDYKMFPPTVDWDNISWPTRRPIVDYPIQSAITEPADGVEVSPGLLEIKGYAAVGGGRGIERIDISVDGGNTWQEATRLPQTELLEVTGSTKGGKNSYVSDEDVDEGRHKWSWVLWTARLPVLPPCQLIVKAVDSSSNVQPATSDEIWNLRGVLNNSWHRVNIRPPQQPHASL